MLFFFLYFWEFGTHVAMWLNHFIFNNNRSLISICIFFEENILKCLSIQPFLFVCLHKYFAYHSSRDLLIINTGKGQHFAKRFLGGHLNFFHIDLQIKPHIQKRKNRTNVNDFFYETKKKTYKKHSHSLTQYSYKWQKIEIKQNYYR